MARIHLRRLPPGPAAVRLPVLTVALLAALAVAAAPLASPADAQTAPEDVASQTAEATAPSATPTADPTDAPSATPEPAEVADAPDRLALLEVDVAARVGADELLPTRDGAACPAERVVSVWEPIRAADIERGGYLSPLVVPDGATGTEATGIVTCDGESWAVAGFDADWDDDDGAWEIGIQPVDLSGGEDHADDVEVGPSTTKDAGSAPELRQSAAVSATSGSVPVPSWPSGIRFGDIPALRHESQTQCYSTIQPGAQALADLLTTTYPSQQRWSVLRGCNVGGKSEHKEGRAVDWYVDAYDADEKAIGDRLTSWLIQDDPAGNAWGGVRHLGVMYMIWNQRGWYQFAAGEGWRDYTGSSPHTNHIHFSMTWPGARCETPWWEATNCSGTSSDRVDRVAGNNRVDTAIALSEEAFDRADTVVVASAADYPDALAASSLAAAVDGPLLLTSPDALSSQVTSEIRRLGADDAFVVGGSAAVSNAVVQALDDDVEVTRLAGRDRVRTSAVIARRVEAITRSKRVLIVRSDSFADALSASNIAGATGSPILLSRSDRLSSSTVSAIRDLDPDKGWVLGGEAAMSNNAWQQARSAVGGVVHRVSGPNRYATALEAAETAKRNGMDIQPTVLASGADYPDALAAGPVAAALDGQLLLLEPTSTQRNGPLLDTLADDASSIDLALIAGGSAAVSPSLDDAVLGAIRD